MGSDEVAVLGIGRDAEELISNTRNCQVFKSDKKNRRLLIKFNRKSYQSIETNTGIFLIAVEKVEQIENGVRLHINIGNPNYADYQDFELLRGDYKDKDLYLPGVEKIKKVHSSMVENRKKYLKRSAAGFFESFATLSLLVLSHKIKERSLEKKDPLQSIRSSSIVYPSRYRL